MRKFSIKAWEEVLSDLNRITFNKKLINSFRIEYYAFINAKNRNFFNNKFIENILGYFSELRYILKGQFHSKYEIGLNTKYFVFISDNNSYLKTILPVINCIINSSPDLLVLCPANHYSRLLDKLDPKITDNLLAVENIPTNENKINRMLSIVKALIFSTFDYFWLSTKTIKRSIFSATGICRISLVYHYYSNFWLEEFKKPNRKFLAADDKYLWESFFFEIIRKTNSPSYVLQHGKLSDLYFPTSAKIFTAWGKTDFEILCKTYLADPQSVVIAGSPYFDKLYNYIINSNIPLKDERKYLYFLGQPFYRILKKAEFKYKNAIEWYFKLSESHKIDKIFGLKPHPHDQASYYSQYKGKVEIINKDIIQVLEESFIMVTVDSTSMLEAALTKTPCIQLIPDNHEDFYDNSPTGISLKATTYEEFEDLVFKLYNEPEFYDQTLKNSEKALGLYFENLGHSVEKIVEMLDKP